MNPIAPSDGHLAAPDEDSPTLILRGSSPREFGEASTPLAAFVPGEVAAQRFEVVRFLGQGGMGQVFEAYDLELGSTVALKVLRPEIASRDSAVRRLKREVQLARQVTHPHVCRVYDLVHHESTAHDGWGHHGKPTSALTMEMLEGETLETRLRRDGRLSPREALPLIAQMAQALDTAHDKGVVHRDFKSANVMLVASDNGKGSLRRGSGRSGPRAVVTDFGLAVALHDETAAKPRLSLLSGTPAYVAPELIEGRKATAAADVYSFGVVIYEMMTGRLPFRGETPKDTIRLRLEVPPPPPSRHRPELGPAWDSAILRCLCRDPAERFERAEDVIDALAGKAPGVHRKRRAVVAAMAGTLVLAPLLWRQATQTEKTGPGDRRLPALGVSREAALDETAAVDSRSSIAFLGFANISGNSDSEWISTALTELTAAELTAGRELRAVSRTDVEQFRRELDVSTAERFSQADFQEAHDRLNADYLILGSYVARSDRSLTFDVRLRRRALGEEVTVVERGHEEEIVDLGLNLAAGLRPHLGLEEPGPRVRASGRPLRPETSQLYDRGLAELRRFEPVRARELLERAAALEPEAPATLAALSAAWASTGELTRAEAEARRAHELAGDLSWDERLRIEGRYRETTLDWTRAREIYQVLWRVFPDSLQDGLRLLAVETRGEDPARALATVDEIRERFDAASGPQLDLAEARAAQARGLRKRQRQAATRAAAAGEALGAKLLVGRARMLEAEALYDLGQHQVADTLANEALEILEAHGDQLTLAWTFITWDGAPIGLDAQEVLELFRAAGDRLGEARTRIRLAWELMRKQEDSPAAAKMLGQVLETARELGDRRTEAHGLNRLAILYYFRDDLHRSTEIFREATQAARASGDLRLQAGILGNYAHQMTILGESHIAREVLEETLVLARRAGSRGVLLKALTKSASSLMPRGDVAAAESRLLEALGIAQEMGSKGAYATAARYLGTLYKDVDAEKARYWLSLSAEMLEPPSGDAFLADFVLADLLIAEARFAEAEALLQKMSKIYPSDDDFNSRYLLLARATLRVEQRRYSEAFEIGSLNMEKLQDVRMRHRVQYLRARIDAALGNVGEALAAIEELIAEARDFGHVLLGLNARLGLGVTLIESGNAAAGRAELTRVAQRARELGLVALADRAETMKTLRDAWQVPTSDDSPESKS